MTDLVFISMENWDEIWRRNQFVCAELARRHPDMRIVFLGLPRNVWRYLARGDLKPLLRSPTRALPDYPNIVVSRALRLGLERFAWGRRLNETLTRTHLRRLMRRFCVRKPLLWLNPHYGVHLVGRMDEQAVIYDITDDWTQIEQTSRATRLAVQQDRTLCRRADAVIVCSERLYELKHDRARPLYLIPNGVDADHYLQVLNETGSLPEATASWKKPVLGYVGTSHPDRVDVDLVIRLARAFARGTIALIGPEMLRERERRALRECGNVALVGPIPYAQVPKYMRAFDVCITPHLVTEFTESLNPIKLWEYLAAGKPIVSTDVAGFREYPKLVRIARTGESFVLAIREALSEPIGIAGERQQEARRHSWQSRVDGIEEVIEACLHRKQDLVLARA